MTAAKPSTNLVPPYVSYKTFRNYLDSLKQDGIPGRLDGSVMKNLSGQAQSQLRGALRFFDLINDDNIPGENLDRLVHSQGPDRQMVLQETVKAAYHFIFGAAAAIDITKATPQQFSAVFKDAGLGGDTVRKGESFFIQAAGDAGIPISRHIKVGRASGDAGRSPRSKPRKPSNGRSNVESPGTANGSGPTPPSNPRVEPQPISLRAKLLQSMVEKFPEFNPEWTAEAQGKWLDAWERVSERILYMTDDSTFDNKVEEG